MEISFDAVAGARAVLIAGPTASGKSAAALRLAEEAASRGRAAVVVNADAMQVYDGLRILTARPGPAEEMRVAHRLYGNVPPDVRHSVGAWLSAFSEALREAEANGALPIVVGGTGLYFKALTEGIASIPEIPENVRARFAEEFAREGAAGLHARLGQRDPESAAAIRPSDPQRILRALEVLEATGRPLAEWQRSGGGPPLLPLAGTLPVVIDVDRRELHRRIAERFDRMVDEGALEEVEELLARSLPANLPAMKAIGVREFAAVLRGEMALNAAIEAAKSETRRYAKRQSTWFRHQMPGWWRVAG